MADPRDEKIALAVEGHRKALEAFTGEAASIKAIADAVSGALKTGGKLLVCGNGGSACDSQHFAGEIVGRFRKERRAMPAIALSADSSILTCVGNDYGFDRVFERQVEAYGRAGDVLVAISTSGSSPNVLRAAAKARELGLTVIGFFGKGGGPIQRHCQLSFLAPAAETARVQEMHILAIHLVCELVEETLPA